MDDTQPTPEEVEDAKPPEQPTIVVKKSQFTEDMAISEIIFE